MGSQKDKYIEMIAKGTECNLSMNFAPFRYIFGTMRIFQGAKTDLNRDRHNKDYI